MKIGWYSNHLKTNLWRIGAKRSWIGTGWNRSWKGWSDSEGEQGAKKPHAHKNYKQRFCEIAVEKGYISPEQLKKALSVQRSADRRVDKNPDLIGEILYKLGFMRRSKIKKVIDFIERAQNAWF